MKGKQRSTVKSISIVGSGTVGTIIGKGFLSLGYKVIFYDIDDAKIDRLVSLSFEATSTIENAILNSQISFICVPTPTSNGTTDFSHIKNAARTIGSALGKKQAYHLIVVKSTVLPTTTENLIIPELEHYSNRRVGRSFGVCCNPEFLTEINASWTSESSFSRNFFSEPCVVIGEYDKKSGDLMSALYEPLRVPIIRTNLRTAELIKYSFNCALSSRISYWNEIFYVCRALGVDSKIVASAAAMDPRIGKYGTIHGKAFGGKCLPKDLAAFITFARKLGYEPKLLQAVEEVNARIADEFGVRE